MLSSSLSPTALGPLPASHLRDAPYSHHAHSHADSRVSSAFAAMRRGISAPDDGDTIVAPVNAECLVAGRLVSPLAWWSLHTNDDSPHPARPPSVHPDGHSRRQRHGHRELALKQTRGRPLGEHLPLMTWNLPLACYASGRRRDGLRAEGATGIEPAWPAWITALDAWPRASFVGHARSWCSVVGRRYQG